MRLDEAEQTLGRDVGGESVEAPLERVPGVALVAIDPRAAGVVVIVAAEQVVADEPRELRLLGEEDVDREIESEAVVPVRPTQSADARFALEDQVVAL